MAVLLSLLVIITGCVYATAVRHRIGHSPTAKERLLWVLPALALFGAGPFIISTEEGAVLQGLEGWCIGWVGGGKLVSVALKTSPIDVNCTGPQFLLLVALPILPVDRVKFPNAPAQSAVSIFIKLIVAAAFHLLLFVPLTQDVAAQAWKPHPAVEAIIVCGVLWSFLEMLFHTLNLLAACVGVPTKPSMRNPLLSTSLRDFWARRWNLPTSESIRVTCYDPLVSFLAPATGAQTPADNGNSNPPPASSAEASPSRAAARPSSSTVTQRRATASSGSTEPPPSKSRHSRSPRQMWAAFAGLCFSFLISGAVHHWLIGLFTKMDLLADYRFGTLFWIQPPLITAQEAFIRSGWWRAVTAKAPIPARLLQWASTVVLFMVPCWFLMRDPFMDNARGREFVLLAMRDLSRICRAVLPAGACTAAARLEPLLDAATGR